LAFQPLEAKEFLGVLQEVAEVLQEAVEVVCLLVELEGQSKKVEEAISDLTEVAEEAEALQKTVVVFDLKVGQAVGAISAPKKLVVGVVSGLKAEVAVVVILA